MGSLYGTLSQNHTAKWHPEPTFRGTSSILTTCLITMGLCIWTAVHVNIPEHECGEKPFFTPKFWRKLGWLVTGLLGPEIVAWAAFEQRRSASRVFIAMRQHFQQPIEPPWFKRVFNVSYLARLLWKEKRRFHKPYTSRYEWTMTHSQYVVMGGFAIDVSEDLRFLVLQKYHQFTLTVDGFLWLVEHYPDAIPNLSQAEIQDKSKSNALAKILVCVQAIWFCLQCLFRLSQRLSICLLELNTFAHAICTLLVYVLWWDKPLDIEEPTVIRQISQEAIALLMVQSAKYPKSVKRLQPQGLPRRSIAIVPNDSVPSAENEVGMPNEPAKLNSIRLSQGQTLRGMKIMPQIHFFFPETFVPKMNTMERIGIPFCEFLAISAWSQKPYADISHTELACLKTAIDERSTRQLPEPAKIPLTLRIEMLPAFFQKDEPEVGNSFAASFAFASICYGALHLTAWNAPFPSSAEMLLWRISGIHVLVLGAIYALWYPVRDNMLPHLTFSYVFAIFFMIPLCLLYIFSRVFLVVECFLVMPHLPESVFQVPSWSQYFPHIG